MDRIIIYAMGQVFENNRKKICWDEVIAIADKRAADIMDFQGISVILPQQILEYKFDYIAVFSNRLFEEIKTSLIGDFFIPEEKIVSWRFLVRLEERTDEKSIEYYKMFIKEFQFHRILDIGMPYFAKYFFNIEKIFPDYFIQMDGVGENDYLMGDNLYRNVYKNIEECSDKYEVALIWDNIRNIDENIRVLQHCTRYILIHTFCSLEERDKIKKIDEILEKYSNKKRFSMSDIVVWLVDLSPKAILEEMSIFVVTHKSYNVRSDDLYIPICVGDSYQNEEFLVENKGDNISYLNEKINECTALYWIWKNTDTEYVGLNHYRRYFYNNNIRNIGNFLDKESAYNFLQEYDILLATTAPQFKVTVLDKILETMDSELCMKALKIMKKFMHRHQPEYVDVFEYVMKGRSFYPCHMFITRRKILNSYCEWLFSFLIEAAEDIDIEKFKTYDRRAMGFIAERLLTTWLLKQNLKIKELPYVLVNV